MEKSICFTGHRPTKIGGYGKSELKTWVREQLTIAIIKAYHKGNKTFISGGAIGTDQIAAEIVMELKEALPDIRLIIARPFPSQSSKWPQHVQEKFNHICNNADKVIDVSPDPFTKEKMQIRNEWMVDNSIGVIAVWDGSGGGTGNCIKYARDKRHIYHINPATKKVEIIYQLKSTYGVQV